MEMIGYFWGVIKTDIGTFAGLVKYPTNQDVVTIKTTKGKEFLFPKKRIKEIKISNMEEILRLGGE